MLEIGENEQDGKWSPLEDDKGITLVVGEETIEFSKVRDGALKGVLQGVTMTFEQKEK